jgi:hypothetical protein
MHVPEHPARERTPKRLVAPSAPPSPQPTRGASLFIADDFYGATAVWPHRPANLLQLSGAFVLNCAGMLFRIAVIDVATFSHPTIRRQKAALTVEPLVGHSILLMLKMKSVDSEGRGSAIQ